MVAVFCFCWGPYASFAMINISGHGKVVNDDDDDDDDEEDDDDYEDDNRSYRGRSITNTISKQFVTFFDEATCHKDHWHHHYQYICNINLQPQSFR